MVLESLRNWDVICRRSDVIIVGVGVVWGSFWWRMGLEKGVGGEVCLVWNGWSGGRGLCCSGGI